MKRGNAQQHVDCFENLLTASIKLPSAWAPYSFLEQALSLSHDLTASAPSPKLQPLKVVLMYKYSLS